MYFKCCEMDEAFDRFIFLLAKRSAHYSRYFHVLSGDATNKGTRNYVLVLNQNEAQEAELTVIEYRISLEDYRQETSRDSKIDSLKQHLPTEVQQPLHTKRFLIVANHRESTLDNDVEVVNPHTLYEQDFTNYPRSLLTALHAARLDLKFGAQNIFEVQLTFDGTHESLKHLLLTEPVKQGISHKPYYKLEPIVKNAIPLLELYEDSRGIELGIFLIREAPRNYALITHIKPARQLCDVTDSTRFIVSDSISLEELRQHVAPTVRCHEVIFREDYGLVYWQRSFDPTDRLRPFLVSEGPDDFERCIPPAHWLNVIYSERTSGKSEFLTFLEREFRKDKAFGWVQRIDGTKLQAIGGLSAEERLKTLCGAQSDQELEILKVLMRRKDDTLLLIDDVDHVADLLVQLLKELENYGGSLKVWVAAGPKTRVLIESKFPIISHEFPDLDESAQATYLKMMLPNASNDEIEKLLDLTRKQNTWKDDGYPLKHPYTGNVFNLYLLVEVGLAEEQPKYEVNLLERFVEKYCPDDRISELERKCYNSIVLDQYDSEVKQLCMYSAVTEYLAARYLVTHLECVTLEMYRNHKLLGNMLDRVLTKDLKLAKAVLNNDLDGVKMLINEYEASIDALQRTPLHICYDALSIGELLVTADGACLEARSLLSNYTPLQMADERHDWKLVNLLLKHGASTNFQDLRLRTMSPIELVKVLDDCIAYNLLDLTRWLLNNRTDIRITQSIIRSLSVYNEFDQELVLRIAELAYEQDLPSREAPYRYMWGDTAFHQAAYNNNLEFCRFLVEKLQFDVDTEDYSGQTALQETSDVAVVEYLRSKSAKKAANEKQVETQSEENETEEEEDSQESVFFTACYSDNLDLVRFAVEREGHNPLKRERGTYGLIRAAAWGSLPIVQYLYDVGFRDHLDLVDDTNYTALATAVRFEHFDVVKFLVEKGADTGKIRDTPANRELLQFMIDRFGFKPDINFDALAKLRLEELRETQFDPLAKDKYGNIFLHYYVAYHNNPDILRFLLTKYDDVDLECEDTGRTALHEALIAHHKELVDVLLQAGADYRKRCRKTGASVLHFAAGAHDRYHLDKFLAMPGISIDDRNNDGETIMFFLNTGSTELTRYLVDRYGLDVNAQNKLGHTKLHETVIRQGYFHLQDLEFLLRDVGIKHNITDQRGRLALHYAVEIGDSKAVRLLGRYGYLEIHLKDQDGKSPLMLAQEHNRSDILDYFKTL